MINNYFTYQMLALNAFALVLLLAGCSSPVHENSLLEKNWGRSFEAQLHLQTANPEAGKQPAKSTAMDGASLDYVMDVYRKSFSERKKKKTVNIIKLR